MKSAFEMKGPKSTTAVALLDKKTNHLCGRLVANWSDNPSGTVCTVTIQLYISSKHDGYTCTTGTAGGYGYDKLSSAIYDALKRVNLINDKGREEIGCNVIKVNHSSGNQQQAFEDAGYIWVQVL